MSQGCNGRQGIKNYALLSVVKCVIQSDTRSILCYCLCDKNISNNFFSNVESIGNSVLADNLFLFKDIDNFFE